MREYIARICDEIRAHSRRRKDGKWEIPIVLDYDYTLTDGRHFQGEAVDILSDWEKDFGCVYILHTSRGGRLLQTAVDTCKAYGITFKAVNSSPYGYPYGGEKIWAAFCIDDRNVGTSLNYQHGFVNWKSVAWCLTDILREINQQLNSYERKWQKLNQ